MAPVATIESPSHVARDITVGVLVLVVGAALLLFGNLPTRTSVLESRVDNLERGIDMKLSDIQARLPNVR